MNIIQSPSPNFDSRQGYKPELLVIHCTDGNWDSDMGWLRSPVSVVSSHFVVSPSGEVHQLVSTDSRAWHAGKVDNPTAKLKKNVFGVYINPNFYSIGIEVSLRPPAVMPDVQRVALLELMKMVLAQYNIPIDRDHIVGHREIYSPKTCPGTISVDELVSALQPPVSTNAQLKAQIMELLNKIQ